MKIILNILSMGLMVVATSTFSFADSPYSTFQAMTRGDLYRSCMAAAKHDCNSWAAEGGGSEGPRGLNADTRAELAQDERYILTGVIDIRDHMPYLQVSFKAHPWLMNQARVRAPYYRISDSLRRWVPVRGQEVSIIVTARYRFFRKDGKTVFEIFLEPSSDPMPSALQRRVRR